MGKRKRYNPNWYRSNKSMAPKKKDDNVLTIEGKSYPIDKLSDDQKRLMQHIESLENKIHQTRFNLDELVGGHTHFYNKLVSSLK